MPGLYHLRNVCDSMEAGLPKKCWIEVVHGAFDSKMSKVLNLLDEQKSRLAPSFVMVDPFGVKGTPMHVLKHILRNPHCEVYISVMYESMNRFMNQPEFEPHLDSLFGCKQWRAGIKITDSQKRKRFIYDLYRSQLKAAGARQVVHFDLYEGDRLIYAIFFATASPKGCDLMKQAIWKVAPFGDYAFHGSHSTQLMLGLSLTDFLPLQRLIGSRFRDKGWVSIQEISDYVASDECDYHTGHLKKGALKTMEREGILDVNGATRSRRFTFPDGTRVRISGS